MFEEAIFYYYLQCSLTMLSIFFNQQYHLQVIAHFLLFYIFQFSKNSLKEKLCANQCKLVLLCVQYSIYQMTYNNKQSNGDHVIKTATHPCVEGYYCRM